MSNFLYVDNSNVWIEGMRISAVKKGRAKSLEDALQKHIIDQTWKLDFGKLLDFAGGHKTDIGAAKLFGSRPPPNDNLWKMAEKLGFEVVTYERNASNKEKKIDTDIVATMIEDSFQIMESSSDELTLVAGDGDYVPAVEKIIRRGFKVDVVFWAHAAHELQKCCSKFISLDPYFSYIGFDRHGSGETKTKLFRTKND